MSLRETQVLKLQKEIAHESGVKLTVRKRDCHNSIAFIEWFGSIWIAGWKQKEFPNLHNIFHLGDRVMKVNGEKVYTVQHIHMAVKSEPTPTVDFVVQRVPHGKVF